MIRRLIVTTTLALALLGGVGIAAIPAASSTPTSTASVTLASVSTVIPAPAFNHCPRYGCRPFHRRPFFFAHPRFHPWFYHPRFQFHRHRW
jgi:hypothetical protein